MLNGFLLPLGLVQHCIYSTTWCSGCREFRAFTIFSSRRIVFCFKTGESLSGGISITIQKRILDNKKHLEKNLNQRQNRAIEYLYENNTITNKIYQELCKVSKATATRDLTELVEKFEKLERIGDVGAGTTYKLIGS